MHAMVRKISVSAISIRQYSTSTALPTRQDNGIACVATPRAAKTHTRERPEIMASKSYRSVHSPDYLVPFKTEFPFGKWLNCMFMMCSYQYDWETYKHQRIVADTT